ncbi:MAG: bifunctional hydroxymethylpyrimidine kinase/phosphomethylpyrimidine kinase [Xanthobacteraceae bacterium]
MATPVAVTIAGSDSGGGAGIQADLKTFSALGVYGACVIAALTAQNTKGVFAVHQVPADFITAQIEAVFSDFAIGAVKIGMLGNRAAIEAVAAGIERHQARNVVLDPVMAATSGEKLLNSDALDALRKLIAHANVLTPNLPEAAALLNELPARDEGEMLKQAERLLEFGTDAVLIKGGHGGGPDSVDLLVEPAGYTRFSAPRIETSDGHGTGCSLASAIAAGLAKGYLLGEAVGEAKTYVADALAAADRLGTGSGRRPVHHFFKWW